MTGFDSKRDMAADKLQEDQVKYGTAWSQDGKRIDPMSVYKEPAQEPKDIAALVEGMEVSIDVSTGEHDSGNRLFGVVTLVQENQGSKHGLILLVQDPEPNFNPAPLPAQEPVAWTTMPEAEDWYFVSGNKDPNGKLEGKWFPLYTPPTTAQAADG